MIRKVIDVSTEGMYISHKRGFLVLSVGGSQIAEVPIDDIAVLILSAIGASISKDSIMALLDRGAPVVLCGKKYAPESIVVPLFGNYEFTGRLQIQIKASIPLKKQLWKSIIQEKITNHAMALSFLGYETVSVCLRSMVKDVASGDSTNREGYAAREYWGCMFGEKFRRDFDSEDKENVLLNYGYAVLRGMTARAVCGSGLHPSLGLHHKNQKNNYCLVDDLMEPFRPVVDILVYEFLSLYPDVEDLKVWKRFLLSKLPNMDVSTKKGTSPLIKALEYYSFSLYESFCKRENFLCIPKMLLNVETDKTFQSHI